VVIGASDTTGGADFQSARRHVQPTVGEGVTVTRRRLPHWQAGGTTYFLTFRLTGAGVGPASPARLVSSAGFLSAQERAVVKRAILFWHKRRWTVSALTVMPNHVHVLATPLEQAPGRWFSRPKLVQSVKRHSAKQINVARRSKGSLRQAEGFDRIVRDQAESEEKARYILHNAVKAGLVDDGWEWDGFWWEGLEGDAND
jgi:REP element-mobilizing transposase RayT